MQDKIFELIKDNFKNPKFYVALFTGIIIVLLVFPYIDANYFYYNRVEKRIEILKKISELDKSEIRDDLILKEEYDSILKEIGRQKEDSVGNIIITDSNSSVKTKKFLSGGILCWCIAFVCIFIKMGKRWNNIFGVVIFIVMGVVLGYIAVIIPTVFSPKCNYIFIPVLQFSILGILVTGNNKR